MVESDSESRVWRLVYATAMAPVLAALPFSAGELLNPFLSDA